MVGWPMKLATMNADSEKRLKDLVNQTKQYGLVFDKRVVDPVSKRSYPFGYARIDDDIATLVDLL